MYKYILILSLLCLNSACIDTVSTNLTSVKDAPELFQKLLEETINSSFERCYGVSMSVHDEKNEIYWSGAAGFDSHLRNDSLSNTQPFRIASVTKTFVAAAILRLEEEGLVDINESVEKYISLKHIDLLKNDGYEPKKITVRHCLHHSSGIFDYAVGTEKYLQLVEAAPDKYWSRTDQIKLAMEIGEPNFEPGEKYSYGDTGYILLGEIIERQLDTTLAAGLRNLINYEKLGLNNTWLENQEPIPESLINQPVVHRYLRRKETTEWDASIDVWGGGGLVSTNEDLTLFIRQLFSHQIFTNPKTLELMLSKPTFPEDYDFENDERFEDYRLGITMVKIFGEPAFLHSGIWDTIIIYIPSRKISLSVNFTDGYSDRLIKKTIQTLFQFESN